jgi:NAD(P)-dependent dehydrogenase (short-subunit alcohol dehydrogenase family)
MLQNVRRATETNLNLQKEMLSGWKRLWPGLEGRLGGPGEALQDFRKKWSNAILDIAGMQRDLMDWQFDAAMESLKWATGGTVQEPVKEQAPQPVVEHKLTPQPVVEKKPVVDRPVQKSPAQPARMEEPRMPYESNRNIQQKVAIVTGAASGIGEAVSRELALRGAKGIIMVDRNDAVAQLAASINKSVGRNVVTAKVGDTTDEAFRKRVFNDALDEYGLVSICVPAAGITRDGLSVRMDKETGKAIIYPLETFRQVTEVNLLAPIYWGIEMVARIAEDRKQRGLRRWEPEEETQGVIVFLGSVSSQGNKGQIAYAVAKAGLEGAAATLQKEAIFHGVRCGVIHPGFTDTPMVRALGEDYLKEYVLPYTQLRRLIRPEEIADAICFMISNSAVSGELWADAGWHPPA